MKRKIKLFVVAGNLILSGYVPPKPKVTYVTVCQPSQPCKKIQRVVSND